MSVGERQRVEIVRCLLQDPRLLIMDEPTSVLTPQAVETLFETLRRLAAEGCSILYISHKLDEIRALCHGATVLRGGRVTGTCDPRQESSGSLARMMIGGDLPHPQHRESTVHGDGVLVVDHLSLRRRRPVRHRAARHPPDGARGRDRRHRRGVGQRTEGAPRRAVGRAPRRARRRDRDRTACRPAGSTRRSGANWAWASCPRSGSGAARCPRCRSPRTRC